MTDHAIEAASREFREAINDRAPDHDYPIPVEAIVALANEIYGRHFSAASGLPVVKGRVPEICPTGSSGQARFVVCEHGNHRFQLTTKPRWFDCDNDVFEHGERFYTASQHAEAESHLQKLGGRRDERHRHCDRKHAGVPERDG